MFELFIILSCWYISGMEGTEEGPKGAHRAKKKLVVMEQKHVFHGLRFGKRAQQSLLADEIVGVNSKLLQLALQNIEKPSKR